MTAHFDTASRTYDLEFTNTLTGRLQRDRVWKYLDQRVRHQKPLNILELNCGTGEDALHLAKLGHTVTATDISAEMLGAAKDKISAEGLNHKVHLEQLSFSELHRLAKAPVFDLVFSNFGGLNCVGAEALRQFKTDISPLIKPNGALIMVIMPRICIWESFYFMLKRKTGDVFRRKKPSVMADVSGIQVETWYHSPKQVADIFRSSFEQKALKPIGFFSPPSYMESFVRKNQGLFRVLSFLERNFSRFSWQGSMSDHYYIELQAR